MAGPYLDAVNDVSEQWWALGPGTHQLHSPIKVFDIFTIHLEEWGQLLQDVPEPRVHVPLWGSEIIRETTQVRGQNGTRTSPGGYERMAWLAALCDSRQTGHLVWALVSFPVSHGVENSVLLDGKWEDHIKHFRSAGAEPLLKTRC